MKKKNNLIQFLSYNLILNSGKKIRALRNKKNKYSNSCCPKKTILNGKKTHSPPLQVKWSVPK